MSKIILERASGMIELKMLPSITLYINGIYCGVLNAESYEIKEMFKEKKINFYIGDNQIFQRRYLSLEIKHPLVEHYEFRFITNP